MPLQIPNESAGKQRGNGQTPDYTKLMIRHLC